MKKALLKELTLSDVMVALIRQQQTEDRAASLKQYLYKTTNINYEVEKQAEEMILLPDFATKEMTEEQLLIYHIEKNNWAGDQHLNYENLLESVNNKRKKIIEHSANTFEHSETIMHELIVQLRQTYDYLHNNRMPIHVLNLHLQEEYITIKNKIVKIRNIERALDVMKLWNKSNISKILNIKVDKIAECKDIGELFSNFEQIIIFLNENQKELTNFSNLLSLISQRKRAIVMKINQNAIQSIMTYSNEVQYGIKYSQYMFIMSNNLILADYPETIERQCIFKEERLCSVLERNIHEMYFGTLSKKMTGFNIEMLNEDAFIDFFLELMEQFSHYFNNWHKVTTYHIHQSTPFKDGFIKYRTTVYQRMLERISQSLKFSNKFNCLGINKQLQLFEKLNDFIECGQQWMGKCKSNLPQVLLEKYRLQMENFFKTNNGDLKSCLLQEFNFNAHADESVQEDNRHFKESDRLKTKISLQDQIQSIIRQFSRMNINVSKIQKLFYERQIIKQAQNRSFLTEQTLKKELSQYWQKFSTKLGYKLFKNIVEYQLREHYLPDNTQLYQIYQHLQFLIIVLYKICLPNSVKKQIEKDAFNDFERQQKINTVRTALVRGTIDESTLTVVNELRHIFIERINFGQLYDFLTAIGNKYDGTSITTYINPSLYYQDFERYEVPIAQLNEKILMVMQQLYLMVEYLQIIIKECRFYKSSEEVHRKVIHLKDIIPSIVLVYFISYFQHSVQKYYKHVLPMFMNLKFDIKKLGNDTLTSFKQFRTKLSDIYKQSSIVHYSKNTCFHNLLFAKQVEYFYKYIIDMYSRIDKINDNGRQIIKSEQSEYGKLVGFDKTYNNGDNWLNMFDLFLELSKERSQKTILQKIDKLVLQFPIQWWKSSIMWIYSDCSSKQKKEYLAKLVSIYINKLMSFPKI